MNGQESPKAESRPTSRPNANPASAATDQGAPLVVLDLPQQNLRLMVYQLDQPEPESPNPQPSWEETGGKPQEAGKRPNK